MIDANQEEAPLVALAADRSRILGLALSFVGFENHEELASETSLVLLERHARSSSKIYVGACTLRWAMTDAVRRLYGEKRNGPSWWGLTVQWPARVDKHGVQGQDVEKPLEIAVPPDIHRIEALAARLSDEIEMDEVAERFAAETPRQRAERLDWCDHALGSSPS